MTRWRRRTATKSTCHSDSEEVGGTESIGLAYPNPHTYYSPDETTPRWQRRTKREVRNPSWAHPENDVSDDHYASCASSSSSLMIASSTSQLAPNNPFVEPSSKAASDMLPRLTPVRSKKDAGLLEKKQEVTPPDTLHYNLPPQLPTERSKKAAKRQEKEQEVSPSKRVLENSSRRRGVELTKALKRRVESISKLGGRVGAMGMLRVLKCTGKYWKPLRSSNWFAFLFYSW